MTRGRVQAMKHKLVTYQTTIISAGERITTGHCACGWRTDVTYVYEAKQAYRKHVSEARAKEKARKVG